MNEPRRPAGTDSAPATPPPSPPARRRLLRLLRILGAGLLALAAILPLARLAFFRGPHLPVSGTPPSGIVDLHCHTAGIGAGDSDCFVSPALRANFRFRIYLQAFGVTEADLARDGDAILVQRISESLAGSRHVRATVLLALDGVVDVEGRLDTNRTEVFVPNAFVARETRRHPNLLFGASIHPHRPDALRQLDQVARDGAVLVKWIPSIMAIDPADPRHIPFYRRMKELGLPLLSHTGPERSFTSSQDALAHPDRLRLPLEQGLVVIAAHAAAGSASDGISDFDRVRRLMREFPNLHADISALTQVNRLGALRDALLAPECRGRLAYGSDFPLINTALVSPWYFPLELTERRRRAIAELDNPWDRDVALKHALGVPESVFLAGAGLLRLP